MQQVKSETFLAGARMVSPRTLPVPVRSRQRRLANNLGRAWVLHRQAMLRGVAVAVLLAGAALAYQLREPIVAGAAILGEVAQGRFADAGLAKLAFLIRKALPALFKDMDLIAILLGQAGSATRLKEKLDYLASLIASIIGECVEEKGENPRTAIPELEAGLLVMLLGSLESLRLSRRIDTGIGAEEIIAFLASTVEATLGRALPEV